MSQLRWVQYQLDPLIEKGKRAHLGPQQMLDVKRLTAEKHRLSEKLHREKREAEEARKD